MLRISILLYGLTMHVGLASKHLVDTLGPKVRDERGDVPGWVMITLMSALLVAALLAVAGPRLQDLFNQAIDRVSGLG